MYRIRERNLCTDGDFCTRRACLSPPPPLRSYPPRFRRPPPSLKSQCATPPVGTVSAASCAIVMSSYYQMSVPRLGGHVHRTEDGGKTWTTLEGDLPSNAYEAVSFVDAMHGWVCRDGGHTALTEDGGKSWSEHDVPHGGAF